MIQHLVDQMVEGQKGTAPQSRRLVQRWRAPLVALLAALCLNAILLFAMGDKATPDSLSQLLLGGGETAVAIAAPLATGLATGEVAQDGSTLHYGVVLT